MGVKSKPKYDDYHGNKKKYEEDMKKWKKDKDKWVDDKKKHYKAVAVEDENDDYDSSDSVSDDDLYDPFGNYGAHSNGDKWKKDKDDWVKGKPKYDDYKDKKKYEEDMKKWKKDKDKWVDDKKKHYNADAVE